MAEENKKPITFHLDWIDDLNEEEKPVVSRHQSRAAKREEIKNSKEWDLPVQTNMSETMVMENLVSQIKEEVNEIKSPTIKEEEEQNVTVVPIDFETPTPLFKQEQLETLIDDTVEAEDEVEDEEVVEPFKPRLPVPHRRDPRLNLNRLREATARAKEVGVDEEAESSNLKAMEITAMVQKVVDPTDSMATQLVSEVEEQGQIEAVIQKNEEEVNEEPQNKKLTRAEKKQLKQNRALSQDPRKATKKQKIWAAILTFLNIGAISCFVLAYGPFSYLRELYVTTAMKTMSHKYLANVLYSTETIKEILANNTIIEPDEVMDSSAISIGNISEPETFSNVYEQQVLQRDEGNDVYKMIKLNEDGYKGYLVFVYDPHMVQLAVTKYLGVKGQYVTTFVKQNNAYVGINAGGFKDYGGDGTGGMPSGYVIQDGKVKYKRTREATWGGGTIGFTQDGVLTLTKKVGAKAVKMGIYDGVDFGPFLIVNGKSAEVNGNGGWGIHPRTIIGQRQDGIVVFLVVDGRSTKSTGIDLNTAIDILKRYNVYNAANLDGGASSALATEGGKLVNNPTWYSKDGQRETPTAWVVVDVKQPETTTE